MLLPKQYVINSLLDLHYFKQVVPHWMATSCLTSKQSIKIKSLIIDINHYLNQILPVFDNLIEELFRFPISKYFSDYFSLNIVIVHFNSCILILFIFFDLISVVATTRHNVQ